MNDLLDALRLLLDVDLNEMAGELDRGRIAEARACLMRAQDAWTKERFGENTKATRQRWATRTPENFQRCLILNGGRDADDFNAMLIAIRDAEVAAEARARAIEECAKRVEQDPGLGYLARRLRALAGPARGEG